MNQNRNQNRRRGRGSNRGQGGGGNPGNRIDSRARGNAPQMLEKYKKLAHDASLNGDRVQTEYYLQFADHYFRVVAEMRSQSNEQRPPRQHDRDQPFENEDYDADDGARGNGPQGRRDRYEEDRQEADEGQRATETDEPEEATADDNPFIRDTRGSKDRGERSDRGGDRDRPRGRGRNRPANDASDDEPTEAGIDPGLLPPSISREEEPAPRPARTRTRRPRPADDEGDEALEAAS